MQLGSTAFHDGEHIPKQYSCDGKDISPPLAWTDVPEDTQSFALICDDPDAPGGTWVHWVLYTIPASETALQEGLPASPTLENGARQGLNDFGNTGYGGPCPPGGTHRYFFTLYALDTPLERDPGLSKTELLSEMNGHILAKAEWMGRYQR